MIWRHKFEFTCKLNADPQSGILKHCSVRLSVRKETKGGRTAAKVGLVDLNLAEFAGSNHTSRHCLLEGYNQKNRLDNSILKIVVGMTLLSGDPCYKVPTPHDKKLRLPTEASVEVDGSLVDSDSSGFGSLPRPTPKHRIEAHEVAQSVFERGHTRNSSAVSQRSSDYGSHHSRTPSNISQGSCTMDAIDSYASTPGSVRSPKKTYNSLGNIVPPRPLPPRQLPPTIGGRGEFTEQNRVDNTRVDNEDIVNKLMEDQDFTSTCKDSSVNDNLQLYKLSDGSTALGGQNLQGIAGLGVYTPVVIGVSDSRTHLRHGQS